MCSVCDFHRTSSTYIRNPSKFTMENYKKSNKELGSYIVVVQDYSKIC